MPAGEAEAVALDRLAGCDGDGAVEHRARPSRRCGAAPRVLVPRTVAAEIEARGPDDAATRALSVTSWLHQVDAPPVPEEVLAWDLGPGESAVLSWALAHPGCLAVIDDLEGRRCAETLGIRLRGTVGLVLRARRQNVIAEARPVLGSLRGAGMYLSPRLLDAVLVEIGE